ncbi:MAG TPA: hypothetical protein VN656_07655 [Stellaceae bacterium]|jgi:hypothetical protein|nr:hypothetical protein [Stellaceae bacterium]
MATTSTIDAQIVARGRLLEQLSPSLPPRGERLPTAQQAAGND